MTRSNNKSVRIMTKDGTPITVPLELIQQIKIPGVEINRKFNRLLIDLDKNEHDVDKAIRKALTKAGLQ